MGVSIQKYSWVCAKILTSVKVLFPGYVTYKLLLTLFFSMDHLMVKVSSRREIGEPDVDLDYHRYGGENLKYQ